MPVQSPSAMMFVPRRFAVLALLFLPLIGCSSVKQSPPSGLADNDLSLYRSVLDRVKQSYVEPVTDDKLVANSLKGMLTGLDPHSDYMTESEYQDMLDDNSGEFAGIGAELTRDDNRPKVIT